MTRAHATAVTAFEVKHLARRIYTPHRRVSDGIGAGAMRPAGYGAASCLALVPVVRKILDLPTLIAASKEVLEPQDRSRVPEEDSVKSRRVQLTLAPLGSGSSSA